MEDYTVEGDLRREVALNIKDLLKLDAIEDTRHRRGLPVRGQKNKNKCSYKKKGPRKFSKAKRAKNKNIRFKIRRKNQNGYKM